MDRKAEEKLKNDLADAVLITAAAQKFNAVGGWEKFGAIWWGVLLILGGISAVLLPVILGIMLLTKQMDLREAFDEFGAAFGIVYIFLYLLIRWLIRKLIKTVTRDPRYFDSKKTIMEVSQLLGCTMIIISVLIAFMSIASTENTFWFFVIAFTGCFIPLSRFLPGEQKHAGASSGNSSNQTDVQERIDEMEDDDFEQF